MATTINYARPSRHHHQQSSEASSLHLHQHHTITTYKDEMTAAVIPAHSMHFPSVEGSRSGFPRIDTEARSSNIARRTTRVSSPSPSAPLRQSSLRPSSPSSSRSSPAEERSPVESRTRYDSRASIDRAPRANPKRQSTGPDRPRQSSRTSQERERRPQQSSHNPYRNLEVASLSTPELHLASDPLLDTDEPVISRKRIDANGVGKTAKRPSTKVPSIDTHGVSSAGLMSISAVMSTVASGSRRVSESRRSPPPPNTAADPATGSSKPRDRKLSAALLGRTSKKSTPSDLGAPSEVSSTGSQVTLGGGNAGNSATATSSQTSQDRPSISNPSTWFKRQRRWSAHARSAQDDSSTSSRPIDVSEVSMATTRTGGTTLSSESTAAHPRTSFGHESAPASPPTALEKLRSARAFMIEELGQLSIEEMGEDKTRIASLAWFEREREAESRGLNVDSSREIVEFWTSIADGVLLCLLANCLRPGSVDRIDRRDVEWVKADNISRFLRAARDHIGLRSKDLFQTLDLTDATTIGLDRVVHTLLAVQSQSQQEKRMSIPSRLHSSARRSSSTKSSSRTSPPVTPPDDTRVSCEVVSSDIPFPGGGRASPRRADSSPRPQQLTKLQHRQMAERALVANIAPAPLTVDANVRSRRRRSNDMTGGVPLPGSRVKNGSSITFADQAPLRNSHLNGSDEDLVARMPYRDRKLSESAVSLTGVAEEADEDLVTSRPAVRVRPPPSPRRQDSFQLPADDDDRAVSPVSSSQGHAGAHHSFYALGTAGASSGGLASPIPMSRTNSQRRISTELARLGATTPTTDAFDDYAYSPTSNSPVRPGGGAAAMRRHSLRTPHTPSSLNPSRDAIATDSTPITPSPGPPPARVPFPRSVSSNDSPSAKRIGRHLSLNAGIANSSWIAATEASSFSPTSPKAVPSGRPAYRHMRYSSDLHLPTTQSAMREQRELEGALASTTLGTSDDRLQAHSFASTSALSQSFTGRPRYESEVASSFYGNTQNSFTTTDETGVSRLTRDPSLVPSSKHKLVVKEEGKPNVTYQVGNCIGRGQFGSVYRALNLNSGQMVAVKRIKLEGRSETEVTQLMHEVDLLKSLTHPSVVKYEGLVRGPDVVSIILEYVENGSLLHTLKAFGHFPEKLVASYVVKILEGLNYLHDMKVVHCDLKAANILTTKNGNVKLSDFGVSLNLKAAEKIKTEKADAIGTPNWMAPEVIELKGASTAADIWSLACTIIELLTGKPPYGDMLAMSAMFRIVEDDCPPIPEKVSEPLREFLISCFNKEPSLRPTAEELCDHVWLKTTWTGHKQLRTQDSVPFLRRISADFRKLDPSTLADLAGLPTTMERSTSSPPPLPQSPLSVERPQLNELRASSTPNVWPANSGVDGLPTGLRSMSPASPSVLAILDRAARRGSDSSSVEMLRSPLSAEGELSSPRELPVVVTSEPIALPANPSMLDLDQLGIDEDKPHAFVKSTFSKAVQCKVCREPVKKHAVLCEECGLVCHARCTSTAPSPCNLRAQLILFANGRSSGEAARISSPSPSTFSVSSNHPPSSPLMSPISFKFPFARNKRNSRGYDAPTSPQPAVQAPSPSPSPAPSTASNNKAKDESTSRRRRLSLRPLARQRSPSPGEEPPSSATIIVREPPTPTGPIMVRGDSIDSSTKRRAARRHSSLSYGSISGSSSVSSASVTGAGGMFMVKTTSGGSIGVANDEDLRLNQALKEAQAGRRSGDIFRTNASMMASTPVLGSHAHDAEIDADERAKKGTSDSANRPGRFRRRLSSNNFPFGHSASSLVRGSAIQPPQHRVGHTARAVSMGQQDAFRLLDNNGGVTPTPEMIAERKKRHTKSDCTIS